MSDANKAEEQTNGENAPLLTEQEEPHTEPTNRKLTLCFNGNGEYFQLDDN